MTIRPAVAEDLVAVHSIARANATAPQWTMAQFAEILQPNVGSTVTRTLLVADDSHAVTGFAVISALATVFPVQAELESIATTPERQGQGIGRALLQEVYAWCARNDVAELRLEVRVSNASAISLYERVGFRLAGIRPCYYERPSEDAMCMVSNRFPAEMLPRQVLNSH